MTAPAPAPNPWPAVGVIIHPSPALSPIAMPSDSCTAPGCRRTDTTTADGVAGRRCDDHPAAFQLAYLVRLLEHGWPGTALAYARRWLA